MEANQTYDGRVVVRVCLAVVVACLLATGCVSPSPTTEGRASTPNVEPTATESETGGTEAPTAPPTVTPAATAPPRPTSTPVPTPRRPGTEVYEGYGAWLDVFDWAPAYASSAGPVVTVADLADMSRQGVVTLYFQTSRIDDRGSGTIQNPELVAEFLAEAHALDMAVVGWYLPKWQDADEDLARMIAIADFEVNGQRFDGVAVDIEGVPPVDNRDDWNQRLVALSEQLRSHVDDRALGAIVLPPTVLEVVNPQYWPDFPWSDIAPLYDVWLPMSYWSFRDDDSGFGDGYSYNADSTQRLRSNLNDPEALVHAIGGIGAAATPAEGGEPLAAASELDDFVQSAVDTDAIGLSIYDWASQDRVGRATMADAVAASPLSE